MAVHHGAVQGRRAAHRGAGAAVRHDPFEPRLAAARSSDVGEPIVKPKGIDDVPIVTLTLWTPRRGPRRLRARARRACAGGRVEARARARAKCTTIGGPGRVVRVLLDPERLRRVRARRRRCAAGAGRGQHRRCRRARSTPATATRRRRDRQLPAPTRRTSPSLVVGVSRRPARSTCRDVARVVDGPPTPARYVWFGTGPGAATQRHRRDRRVSGGDADRDQEAGRERRRRRRARRRARRRTAEHRDSRGRRGRPSRAITARPPTTRRRS